MSDNQKHLEDLQQIRSLMEKSTQFISLSGLSGISAGLFGLIGGILAYLRLSGEFTILQSSASNSRYLTLPFEAHNFLNIVQMHVGIDPLKDLILIALTTLIFALISATFFTFQKAKKDGNQLWSSTSKRLLLSVALPLIIGGLFSLSLLKHGLFGLLAPTTLIFYGLALISGSTHTLPEIKYLGIVNITLGLINTIFIGQGLLFWTIGFGVAHIVYGTVMYFKYDRK